MTQTDYRLTKRQREVLMVLVERGALPIPLGPRSRPFHALRAYGYAEPQGRLGFLHATAKGRERIARDRQHA